MYLMVEPATVASIVSLSNILALFGIIGGVVGGIAWYEGKVLKKYAAQADFKELRKQILNMTESVKRLELQDEAIKEIMLDRLQREGDIPSQLLRRLEGKEYKG